MEKKTLKILEYNKIIDMLREQAGSDLTKGIISDWSLLMMYVK